MLHILCKSLKIEVGIDGSYQKNEKWAVKYETIAKEKDGELKVVALQRQWEENNVRLTHLQGEVVVIDEKMLEKLENNFAALSIMGWWLCTKA